MVSLYSLKRLGSALMKSIYEVRLSIKFTMRMNIPGKMYRTPNSIKPTANGWS